jgi:hypothetical protein
MAEELFPDAVITSDQPDALIAVGAATYWQAVDSAAASYINASGQAGASFSLADTATVGPSQLATVSVQFDARPQGTIGSLQHGVIAQLIDGANGAVFARSIYAFTGNTGFVAANVEFGALLTATVINRLILIIFMPGGSYAERWEVNNLRAVVGATFDGPTAAVVAPTGAITDNTPTFVWTAAVHDPATEADAYGRIRVFNAAQYSAGGFDPATSAATWDSGYRVGPPLHEVESVVLPLDTYRAYISAAQLIYPGGPWGGLSDQPVINGGVLQAGPYAGPLSFSIVNPAPIILGPTIKTDAVRDLSTAERALLTEPILRLAPRVTLFSPDGVEVRDLDVTAGSLTLDAAAQIRGTLTLTVSDTDIVPPKREQASGETFPLHPYGSYVHVSFALATGRTSTTYVGVGVYRLTSVVRNRAAGTVAIKAKDFALNLSESRFSYPVTRQDWSTGSPIPYTVLATAQQIIAEAGLAYRTPTGSAVAVAVNYLNKQSDLRTTALDNLSASIDGWVWYFDIDGVCYFGLGPDIVNDPIAYTFYDPDNRAGRLVAQIVSRSQELSRDDTFDVVIASDQAGLYIGGAYDASPNSVIARSAANPAALFSGAGPFSPGGKPFFLTSPIITSLPTAQAAARTRLAGVALPAEQITAESVPIPDMRPDKMIAMPRDGDTDLVKWQVTKVTLPMTEGPTMRFDAVTIGESVVPAS